MRPPIDPPGGLARDRPAAARAASTARRSARRESTTFKPGALAHDRVPSVGADHEIGPDLERPSGASPRTPAMRPPSSISSVTSACIAQVKAGIAAAPAAARKSRKSHCGISAMKWQRVGRCVKSASVNSVSPIDAVQLAHFLVRQREERVEQAELVHDLERRGVDRVAAEIAQEVACASRKRSPRPRRAPAESPASFRPDRRRQSRRRFGAAGHRSSSCFPSYPPRRRAARRAALRRPAPR